MRSYESVRVKLEDAQASDESRDKVIEKGNHGGIRDRSIDGGF